MTPNEIKKIIQDQFPSSIIVNSGCNSFHSIDILGEQKIITRIWDGVNIFTLILTTKQALDFADTYSKMITGRALK